MLVLLVEDESGLREGLADYLSLHGHVVRAVDSCAAALDALRDEDFDVVVTDWRLGDGLGALVLERCDSPAIVMSGHPDEVASSGAKSLLCKPTRPADLLAEIERVAAAPAPSVQVSPAPGAVDAGLPADARARLRLLRHALGGAIEYRVEADELLVVAPLPAPAVELPDVVDRVGGDARILDHGDGPRLELRMFVDGRPDGAVAVRIDDPWPPPPAVVALDLAFERDAERCLRAVRAAAARASRGRRVHILNVEPEVRLYFEATGNGALLPMRTPCGPRLPALLTELWRQT